MLIVLSACHLTLSFDQISFSRFEFQVLHSLKSFWEIIYKFYCFECPLHYRCFLLLTVYWYPHYMFIFVTNFVCLCCSILSPKYIQKYLFWFTMKKVWGNSGVFVSTKRFNTQIFLLINSWILGVRHQRDLLVRFQTNDIWISPSSSLGLVIHIRQLIIFLPASSMNVRTLDYGFNEPLHVVNVSLNVGLYDNHQMLKYQLWGPLTYVFLLW